MSGGAPQTVLIPRASLPKVADKYLPIVFPFEISAAGPSAAAAPLTHVMLRAGNSQQGETNYMRLYICVCHIILRWVGAEIIISRSMNSSECICAMYLRPRALQLIVQFAPPAAAHKCALTDGVEMSRCASVCLRDAKQGALSREIHQTSCWTAHSRTCRNFCWFIIYQMLTMSFVLKSFDIEEVKISRIMRI